MKSICDVSEIKRRIQVHVPFSGLREGLLEHFTRLGLNPEIAFDARALDRFSPADCAPVAEVLRARGLSVSLHAPFMDLSAGSSDPEIRAVARRRFEQLARRVPLFAPLTVVAHAGYDWKRYGYSRPAWIDASVEFWSRTAEALNGAGTRLVLENVYERGPAEIGELLERLRPWNVGLCLDLGHLTAFGRAPLGEWLDSLGDSIVQLHLHDNRGDQDAHMAMGAGRIDFAGLFAFLKARRDTPPLATLEVHRLEDLEPSLGYLCGVWPWRDRS
jgi:sugar phosphate isomerase/epimerase